MKDNSKPSCQKFWRDGKQMSFLNKDKDAGKLVRSNGGKIKKKSIPGLLKLDKPLIVFDLETTGLSITIDKIIEIAYVKIFPDGKVIKEMKRVNPGIKIPKESIEIHGITDEEVKDCPYFGELAGELLEVFQNCDLGGFNIVGFDLPMLAKEFAEAGKEFDYSQARIVDAKIIFHYMEPRDLSAAYKFYCGKEHTDAHSALADTEATAEILSRQLERYPQIQKWDVLKKIHTQKADRYVDPDKRFYWRNGTAYFNFGKYKDQPLQDIALSNPGFLGWILGADFGEEVKEIVAGALKGKFPQR